MAPMFLVSNEKMLIEAARSGITGAIPALNWRTLEAMKNGLISLKENCPGPFGINLIVNKSNSKYPEQLRLLSEYPPDYIITSLGSPEDCIKTFADRETKVFCDVTELKYAYKVADLGADGLIAVNNRAGGHLGNKSPEELIPELKSHFDLPVISAGGVSKSEDVNYILSLGAAGCSVGSIFIASDESPVSEDYKKACVDYGKEDIVTTTKLSGTPCTVIKTPYVEEIGTRQNFIERLLNKNKRLKKWIKMLTFYKGMKRLEKAAFSATYKSVWCAGPSIEDVHSIRPVKEIVSDLVKDLNE